VDYHIFEAKWHDGICYFDTQYTNWKTPVDYCRIFAEESRNAGIPFMFYYSSIFDHNPQFDDIQPLRSSTPSFLAMHREKKDEVVDYSVKFTRRILESARARVPRDIPLNDFTYDPEKYEKYLLNQVAELITNYRPDGMWMDWFMGSVESSAELVMDFIKKEYPNVVLTFNNSSNAQLKWAHYTTGEAHTVKSSWEQGNMYRLKIAPWELVGPAARGWDNPSSRTDPYEAARIAVIIMASGGKFSFGLPSQMDGALYPEPAQHVAVTGDWYRPRRRLFTEALPMQYEEEGVPGIHLGEEGFGTIGSIYKDHNLIHIINFSGTRKTLSARLSHESWPGLNQVILEPEGKEIPLHKKADATDFTISGDDIDPVDTIIRVGRTGQGV
jgi:alpha-L-fucosidase